MKLRFIGEDGSMGLRSLMVYDVKISSTRDYIWVEWNGGICPYPSPKSFSNNWEVA